MKNRKKVLDLVTKLEKWGIKNNADAEFDNTVKSLKKTIQSEEDSGSNPPTPPPGHKPPGGG